MVRKLWTYLSMGILFMSQPAWANNFHFDYYVSRTQEVQENPLGQMFRQWIKSNEALRGNCLDDVISSPYSLDFLLEEFEAHKNKMHSCDRFELAKQISLKTPGDLSWRMEVIEALEEAGDKLQASLEIGFVLDDTRSDDPMLESLRWRQLNLNIEIANKVQLGQDPFLVRALLGILPEQKTSVRAWQLSIPSFQENFPDSSHIDFLQSELEKLAEHWVRHLFEIADHYMKRGNLFVGESEYYGALVHIERVFALTFLQNSEVYAEALYRALHIQREFAKKIEEGKFLKGELWGWFGSTDRSQIAGDLRQKSETIYNKILVPHFPESLWTKNAEERLNPPSTSSPLTSSTENERPEI